MQPTFADHPRHFGSVIDAVLESADPGRALVRAWPSDPALRAKLQKCVLVAAGKASLAMASAAIDQCGVRPVAGVVLAPAGTRPAPALHAVGVRMFEADHPLPSQRNLIAARAVGDAARMASSRGVPMIVLLSGGASAHLTEPQRGLTLSDIRIITEALMHAGAGIAELNAVRTCCEQLKGGGLARLAAPSLVYSFILSDVLGDSVRVIASGPTADVRCAPEKALRVLEHRNLLETAPNITNRLRGLIDKPPPPGAPLRNVANTIIGSNAMAVVAARDALERAGFKVVEARMHVDGEARELADAFARQLTKAADESPGRPIAMVWGGETTVTVTSTPGKPTGHGGRNQEAALAAALALEGRPSIAAMFFATDGVDGVSPQPSPDKPHAGASITGATAESSRRTGVDPAAALARHDSYAFVRAASAALVTGPTGTNVNDIWIGVAYPHGT